MLHVMTLQEANALLTRRFPGVTAEEEIPLACASGRVLAQDIVAKADVPGFVRATVDGYAVRAADTFGCSESIPALLTQIGEARMGEPAALTLLPGQCAAVPTGGELPRHADAMVMLEETDDFGGGTVAVMKPSAPGRHLVFAGDDVHAGDVVLRAGARIRQKDIGVLAALGYAHVPVRRMPRVAVLSTGDELVGVSETPVRGQVRDVNGPMLAAQCAAVGAEARHVGIIRDDEAALARAISEAVRESDMVLLSGGSSVGVRDAAAKLIGALGELLFHGLSVKPGKPTMCGDIGGKPVFGLPGHPVAAYFICHLLVRPVLIRMLGTDEQPVTEQACMTRAIPSNHGREEYAAVRLQNGTATPVMSKSGLISALSGADGYVCIPRDTEGISRGEQVTVFRWEAI